MDLTTAQKNYTIVVTILVGITIVVVASLCNANYQDSLPPLPPLAGSSDAVAIAIENYKDLEIVIEKSSFMVYNLIVVEMLEPLFKRLITAIIAYIFGMPLIKAFASFISSKAQEHP